MLDVSKAESKGKDGQVAFRTRWIAAGTVEHWGHSHNRRNQYDAILTLAPIDDVWKITAIELLEESRLQ